MRSGPATRTAFVRGFLLCLVTAWWRNDCFSPTALQRSAALAKAGCRFVIVRSRTCNRRGVQRSCPAPCFLLKRTRSKERDGGGRPQRPGNQSRSRAFSGMSSGDSPSRVAGCRWLCRNHSVRLRNSHVSLNPLSPTLLRLATQKSCEVVQKLWRMRLPCGRPRKTKNLILCRR
jgi:hypothetical protein